MLPVARNHLSQEMGIVARARCGCVRGLALDIPGDDELIADVRTWRRYGWTLVRMPLEDMPGLGVGCTHPERHTREKRADAPVLGGRHGIAATTERERAE